MKYSSCLILKSIWQGSPSVWRVWIEMEISVVSNAHEIVTLRVEGVD